MTIRTVTLVGNSTIVHVRVEDVDLPRSKTLTVALKDGREWTFAEPGWQEFGYGFHGQTIYLWSARHLIVVPDTSHDELIETRTDDDILIAFALNRGQWLLVCETSVQLWDGETKHSRIELADVADEIGWEPPDLTIVDQRGQVTRINIHDDRLMIQ